MLYVGQKENSVRLPALVDRGTGYPGHQKKQQKQDRVADLSACRIKLREAEHHVRPHANRVNFEPRLPMVSRRLDSPYPAIFRSFYQPAGILCPLQVECYVPEENFFGAANRLMSAGPLEGVYKKESVRCIRSAFGESGQDSLEFCILIIFWKETKGFLTGPTISAIQLKNPDPGIKGFRVLWIVTIWKTLPGSIDIESAVRPVFKIQGCFMYVIPSWFRQLLIRHQKIAWAPE
jgi:hypothetical protein